MWCSVWQSKIFLSRVKKISLFLASLSFGKIFYFRNHATSGGCVSVRWHDRSERDRYGSRYAQRLLRNVVRYDRNHRRTAAKDDMWRLVGKDVLNVSTFYYWILVVNRKSLSTVEDPAFALGDSKVIAGWGSKENLPKLNEIRFIGGVTGSLFERLVQIFRNKKKENSRIQPSKTYANLAWPKLYMSRISLGLILLSHSVEFWYVRKHCFYISEIEVWFLL